MYTLTKAFALPLPADVTPYLGQCEKPDDTDYLVRITVQSEELDANDYVIDFVDLIALYEKHILAVLPQTDFVKTMEQISCERIAEWIYKQLEQPVQPFNISIQAVQLCKDASASVTYQP